MADCLVQRDLWLLCFCWASSLLINSLPNLQHSLITFSHVVRLLVLFCLWRALEEHFDRSRLIHLNLDLFYYHSFLFIQDQRLEFYQSNFARFMLQHLSLHPETASLFESLTHYERHWESSPNSMLDPQEVSSKAFDHVRRELLGEILGQSVIAFRRFLILMHSLDEAIIYCWLSPVSIGVLLTDLQSRTYGYPVNFGSKLLNPTSVYLSLSCATVTILVCKSIAKRWVLTISSMRVTPCFHFSFFHCD